MRAFKMIALAALYSIAVAGETLAAPSDEIRTLLEKGEPRAAYDLARG
jgi:hypothetical protein